eukprot:7405049-Pyramimonas_sp.AAC.1
MRKRRKSRRRRNKRRNWRAKHGEVKYLWLDWPCMWQANKDEMRAVCDTSSWQLGVPSSRRLDAARKTCAIGPQEGRWGILWSRFRTV